MCLRWTIVDFFIDHNFVLIKWCENLFPIALFLLTHFPSSAGLLLREIKDFWPVALLMATLLYPPNVDYTEDLLNRHFELEKRKELFDVVYNEIVKLGKPQTMKRSIIKMSCFLVQSLASNPSPRALRFPVAFRSGKCVGGETSGERKGDYEHFAAKSRRTTC